MTRDVWRSTDSRYLPSHYERLILPRFRRTGVCRAKRRGESRVLTTSALNRGRHVTGVFSPPAFSAKGASQLISTTPFVPTPARIVLYFTMSDSIASVSAEHLGKRGIVPWGVSSNKKRYLYRNWYRKKKEKKKDRAVNVNFQQRRSRNFFRAR